MIKTEKELVSKISECSSCLQDKFNGKGGKRSIIICGGTGSGKTTLLNVLSSFIGNDERIILVSRFDNLGKGASGSAIQNMNILLGVDEKTGLNV